MSLSLLNAYGSSDESDDEESVEVTKSGPAKPTESMKPIESKEPEPEEEEEEESTGGKNFFEAEVSGSDDEDAVEISAYQEEFASTSGLIGPSAMPYAYVDPNAPLYGPAHPSQMYNYAAYPDAFTEPSSAAYQEPEDDDEPPPKRPKPFMTDADVKKLIKKHEVDATGLAMPDELEIIDANVDHHLGNVREQLVRNITTVPKADAAAAAVAALQGGDSKGKGKDGKKPNALAKRKNQITYLAYMAKANEEKLQNEWAKNRTTKRQTQAKYGF